jgi:hypothetical protein
MAIAVRKLKNSLICKPLAVTFKNDTDKNEQRDYFKNYWTTKTRRQFS